MSSYLDSDTEIEGDIQCASDFVFDGSLIGNINSKGSVVIGINGDVSGNVIAEKAVVEGKINGNGEFVTCMLAPSSFVFGSVTTTSLHMEEGASLSGQCKVGKSQSA